MNARWARLCTAFVVAAALAFVGAACGGGGSASPTTPTAPAQTRVIGLNGNLAFGNVVVGQKASATLTITNSGNASLTISGMTVSGGLGSVLASTFTSGAIAAGGSQSATIQFSPAEAISYSGTLTVTADHTSGTNTIAVSGAGVAPTYSLNGTVTDDTGHGVPNVTVQVTSGTNAGKSAVTDSNGNYVIAGLSAGSFTLSFTATNYQTTTKDVTLTTNMRVDNVLPHVTTQPPPPPPPTTTCCKICTTGKPCGDTCISKDATCHVGPGCACSQAK